MVISSRSYGKAGTEQNWGVLTLRPPRQLLDPGTPRRSTTSRHCACSKLNVDALLLCFPISPISGHHLFQSTLIHLGFSTGLCHLAPDLANPGKNPPRAQVSTAPELTEFTEFSKEWHGFTVTDARAGTTTQTLPTGTEFVLCSGTTGTVPLQRKEMLK